LSLNDGEHQEHVLYRLQKGWKLQFRLGPSLLGRRIRLYVNHPTVDVDGVVSSFERTQYRALTWFHESRNKDDDTAMYTDVIMAASGSYHYYFIDEESEDAAPCGSGYFLVDPVLTYGFEDEVLPIDCIHCQTVLSKCLGPFSQWEDRLRVAKETGYNLIHFTPVQELGGSLSCYSLKDQLNLNPMFNEDDKVYTMEDLKILVQKLRNEWKILSLSDIVLNHTANDSPWLKDYPESAYNLINSPHLRPAFLLDRLLHNLTVEIGLGNYAEKGIPSRIKSEKHIQALGRLLKDELLPALHLHEFYLANVDELVKEFHLKIMERLPPCDNNNTTSQSNTLKLIQDPHYQRFKSTVDWDVALSLFNTPRCDSYDEDNRRLLSAAKFQAAVEQLNAEKFREIEHHLSVAVNNVLSAVRYERIQADGPKILVVSVETPLVTPYFYRPGSYTLAEDEAAMFTSDAAYIMAHNGWVMNDDPLRNFAEAGSNVYFRRELIAWGDSVKLRYGERPEDSPYLWDFMREYVEETARVFHGIRLDNCHSTPIHVAQYLLDAARQVRPDLYVIAELFTNCDRTDNIFVNRLGISSLVREAMSAGTSQELGGLIHRFGGEPVGAFIQQVARPLQPSIAHAILLDQSHDNPSPIQKRSVYDLLPSAALVSMASCATGSNRGYDELVPHHIHVVKENRVYSSITDLTEVEEKPATPTGETAPKPTQNAADFGILKAKKALNDLHFEMGAAGYTQIFVDQINPDVVAVTRHSPVTHQSIILIAHTAFKHPKANTTQGFLKPLEINGTIEEVVLEAQLVHKKSGSGGARFSAPANQKPHPTRINGCDEYVCEVRQHLTIEESRMLKRVDNYPEEAYKAKLDFKSFVPGSIVAVRVSLAPTAQAAVQRLRNLITGLSLPTCPSIGTLNLDSCSAAAPTWEELQQAMNSMNLADMNIALYRCDREETDDGRPGSYVIPGHGPMIYCGLQGVVSLLSDIRPKNDLGHPLCHNLREGDWLPHYISNRLQMVEGTTPLGKWLETALSPISDLPRYLVPCYFDAIVTGTYHALLGRTWSLMSRFVNESSTFVKAVALGSVQLGGIVGNASLPELSPALAPPLPPSRTNRNGQTEQSCVTLSAGLPHFSVGYMRNWGRDTFISLRGLFLLTGRYQEARYIILAYGGCLRHGLIPNLLDGGKKARFNCRDAIWWWLQSIKDYCYLVPRGHTILDDAVTRLFPDDESPPMPAGLKDQPLGEVMQEALQRHFQGVSFRERNAGTQIDSEMKDEGFNNRIGVDLHTGFVYGGNSHNCGTWMDKMGSSEKAGNKGEPATPRDGCAVEIVGLSRSVIGFLWEAYADGKYPYGGVERNNEDGTKTRWTFEEWARRIDSNFEQHFWINPIPDPLREAKSELINRRGIYKDSYLASKAWADYQLRPNFVVAMAVAPEMFNPSNAWYALQMAVRHLLGPLGMKTLDQSDWAYRPDYHNSDDSEDPSVAHGFNYHQGPEWLWPVGYLLQALLNFSPLVGGVSELKRTIRQVKFVISRHFVELQNSPWRSLPELTNSNGKPCRDSNPAQAWSMASILEVLFELDCIEQSQKLSVTV
jgi:glycogen debranching enzyme